MRQVTKATSITVARHSRAGLPSTGLLASIVDASEDAIYGEALDGSIISWNHAAEDMYGYTAEEILGRPISLIMPAGHEKEMPAILERIGTRKRVEHYETERLRKDGTSLPVSISVSPIHDSQGKIIGAASIARDIGARWQADREAHAQEASAGLLASIVDSSEDAIISKSLNGVITSWNHAAETMYGYSAAEAIGKPISVLIPSGHEDEERNILAQIRLGNRIEHYETERMRKDGAILPVSLSVSPIHNSAGVAIGAASIARDNTAQKQAAQYARSLMEASQDLLVTVSVEGKIMDVNQATIRVTGVPRDALLGTDLSDYFTQPDKVRAGFQAAFAKGSVSDYPLTIRHRGGRLTEVLYNASVYRDTAGRVLGVFAAARDITAQKMAETEIAERRTKELDRLAELERFQRLTVGRELKMIELKKEISELKAHLPETSTESV